MKNYLFTSLLFLPLCIFGLASCGGGDDDPVFDAFNETLDVEIDYMDVDNTSLYPGEKVEIEWAAEGALKFRAKVYLSEDRTISANDVEVINEECSFDSNRHCDVDEDITFECRYGSDNTFDCKEDGDRLRETDLTPFLNVLPKSAYLILELCNDGECESEAELIVFN